ncbi:hypothetical protein LguiB_027246 [Lonicera macranthoides]
MKANSSLAMSYGRFYCTRIYCEAQRQNIIHDADLQNLLVRFTIDKASLVGVKGPTHCGAFGTSFMVCLPNMVVMAPSCESELIDMVSIAVVMDDQPSSFRYPKGNGIGSMLQPNYKRTPLERESEKRRK